MLYVHLYSVMKKYLNRNGNSGVLAYEIGIDFIRIKFIDGTIYRYTARSTGRNNLGQMIALAKSGRGLSTFISQFIKSNFAEKE